MRNMRNIIIHAYFNVDLTTVWRTVQEDLPPLKQQIDPMLSEQPSARYPGDIPDYDPPTAESTPDHDAGHERDADLEP
jgi:hypothetical protein